MNFKEEYDKYNLLEKDVLIGMLIEENKIDDNCRIYTTGTDASLKCVYCGKSQYEHFNYCLKKY